MQMKLLYLALAGGLGTLARYGLSGLVSRWPSASFPWGTLVVNIVGCFAAGSLWSVFEDRIHLSGELRTVVFVGFMGAFTTFSSYILETGHLARDAEWAWAAGNVLLQNGVGLAALFLGMAVGRLV